jgi:hypothetical protein
MTPIYILPRVPGATNTTEWTKFCQSREPFIVINHEDYRGTSRWRHTERKRKFQVTRYGRSKRFGSLFSRELGFFFTLEKAEAIARQVAMEAIK